MVIRRICEPYCICGCSHHHVSAGSLVITSGPVQIPISAIDGKRNRPQESNIYIVCILILICIDIKPDETGDIAVEEPLHEAQVS